MLRLDPGTSVTRDVPEGGQEILVLEGSFADGDGRYATGTWLRSNDGAAQRMTAPEGCLLFIKTGHLPS